jgi:hypothetical protein
MSKRYINIPISEPISKDNNVFFQVNHNQLPNIIGKISGANNRHNATADSTQYTDKKNPQNIRLK